MPRVTNLKLYLCLILLFCPVAQAEKPVLSLVIDDLGYSFENAREALNLPGQHSFAIIPNTTYARKIANFAHENGHELILHMPMQSAVNTPIEDFALHEQMSETEITDNVHQMLGDIPHISGINNHMGSHLTKHGYIMRPIMETIKQSQKNRSPLYFLDSRTTPQSKAYEQALLAGVPTLKRDVFLDYNHANEESILFQFQRWMKKAREKGYSVAIGHPHQSTLAVLQKLIPEHDQEFDFMSLSQLINHKEEVLPSWPKYLSHWHQDSKNSKQ